MKTISHSDGNLYVYAITQTWNWIVYLITLRITVRDWGRGCYVIITLWTCYENYFTQRPYKLTCLCHYRDMKLNYVPYYLTHNCPRLGKGLLCNYNSLNLLWKIFHSHRNLHVYAITQTWNWIMYLITLRIAGRGCYVIITLWTCYENYFTQPPKLTCLCNYTDMKLNYVPYYLTHNCPRLGKGLLCNYNSLNLLWKLIHTATETYMFMQLHRHEIELCTLLPYA